MLSMEAAMLESQTISISINRNWNEVYEAVWRPESFPAWASGLSKSSLSRDGDKWKAEGPEGSVQIAFTDHNAFGVMDHYVTLGDGSVVYVPLRVIRNGDGAEVMLTLFRQPGMSDTKFAEDAEWIGRDLLALKKLVTR
jgi:hypothetical protein